MSYAKQSAIAATWGPATELLVSSDTSTSAQDLSAYINRKVLFFWIPDSANAGHSCHIRWGNSSVASATTSDLPLTELHPSRSAIISSAATFFTAKAAGGAGSLFWAIANI